MASGWGHAMRAKHLTINLLVTLASLLALLLVAEASLRFAVPVLYRSRFTRIDPVLGWSHYPSVHAISEVEGHRYEESYNSHGYRVPEHDFEKPNSVKRIVVLGDSFVDGSEVGDKELLTWQLQESFTAVEVINLGVCGYSTAQELITLERVALRYDPDLIVLVTVSNDFAGNNLNFSFFGPAPRYVLLGDSLRLEGNPK